MDRREEIHTLCRLLSPAGFKEEKELVSKIKEERIEWVGLVETANLNLLTPALYTSLRDNGVLEYIHDPQLTGFLHEVYSRNRERNEGILRQIKDMETILGQHAIPQLLLKGGAALSESLYPDIGMRLMNDLDIMIAPAHFDEALKLLRQSGYEEFGRDLGRWHHHTPRMSKEGFPAALEPHFRVVFDRNIEYIPFSDTTSIKSVRADLEATYVLKPTWHLYHIFLHTAVIDQNHRKWKLGLRYLYDFVMVAKAYEDDIDWQEMYALARKHEHEKILEDFLYLADTLFGLKTPLRYNRPRGWLHLKKALWESTLVPETRVHKLYRAYTQFSDIYSYDALKRFYGLQSRSQYPAAFVRYIFYHIRKHLF